MYDLRTQLVSRFLTLNFSICTNEARDDFTIPESQIQKWLAKYCLWTDEIFKDKPYYAYNRRIVFSLEKGPFCEKKLESVMNKSFEMGFCVFLRIPFKWLQTNLNFVIDLAKRKLVNALLIDFSDDESLENAEMFFSEIRKINVSLTFMGSLKTFFSLGVFSSPSLNSSDIMFALQEPETCGKVSARRKEMCHCIEKMELFVDAKGFVYPCAGLMMMSKYALGSIFDQEFFSSFNIEGDLLEWAFVGPNLAADGPVLTDSVMSWSCRRHIAEIITSQSGNCELIET